MPPRVQREWHVRLEDTWDQYAGGFSEVDFARTPKTIIKRLHPWQGDVQVQRWWEAAADGEIRFVPRCKYACNSFDLRAAGEPPAADPSTAMFHSFCNSAALGTPLALGAVHVAVGFVDLSPLLAAADSFMPPAAVPGAAAPPAALAAAAAAGPAGPALGCAGAQRLTWHGVELSPHSVAKTLLIAHLLRSGAAPELVLLIWFSASWTAAAELAFRTAAASTAAVAAASEPPAAEPVRALLAHWASAPTVTLAEGRSRWQLDRSRTFRLLANYRGAQDRIAALAYGVTGDLPLAELPTAGSLPATRGAGAGAAGGDGGGFTCGSATMFSQPAHWRALRERDEDFLQGIPKTALWATRREPGCSDVIAAGVRYLLPRLRLLAAAVRSGAVDIASVTLGAVVPEATALIERIRGLAPATISWNNTLDYVRPSAFHALARAASGPHTAHLGYSMNWPRDVKGASVLDMPDADRPGLVRAGIAAAQRSHALLGAGGILTDAPFDHPVNFADAPLRQRHAPAWVRAFFAADVGGPGEEGCPRALVRTISPYCSALQAPPGTVFMAFTYVADANAARALLQQHSGHGAMP